MSEAVAPSATLGKGAKADLVDLDEASSRSSSLFDLSSMSSWRNICLLVGLGVGIEDKLAKVMMSGTLFEDSRDSLFIFER